MTRAKPTGRQAEELVRGHQTRGAAMRAAAAWGGAYLGSIVAANWVTATFGLIPIGFGLAVTAGTFAAGAALLLRDGVQVRSPGWAVPALIVAGACLSYLVAGPALAVASGLAFLFSELVDWAVFTPTRGRSLPLAVLLSSVIAAPVDTVGFLWLAGFPINWQALAGQFAVKTGMAAVAALLIDARAATARAVP